MIISGEASGDFLAAELLNELSAEFPGLTAFGVGGLKSRAAGLESLYHPNELSLIGLAEVVRHLPRLVSIMNALTARMRADRPDLLVTVDLPDFNFRLAKRAKKLGVPVIHYVSPQVWAWRRGRADKLAGFLDHLLALFPFEPEIYAGTGLPVSFVGHPLVHRAQPKRSREQMRADLGLADDAPLIALLPGSRPGEIARLLEPMLLAAVRLRMEKPNTYFAIALADTLDEASLRAHWPAEAESLSVSIIPNGAYDLLGACDAALVASGTATLEAALIGAPMVVVYRVNALTYAIGRRVIQVPYISLANLVAGEGVVPERIQHEANPDTLCQDLRTLLDDPQAAAQQRQGLARIRQQLSTPPRTAGAIVSEFLHQQLGDIQENT
ncbi:putative lipid-A-disaccharide synthase [Magnetofaba australis IT-1]|uniref:Lipid-A-disaccharide synthase n=2 Tax=Magnetofaba TaxID=1472292 RepID=A0A1Y2K6L0_9PROT|nr:putative lipid-A-disaccharide synthase [Magnetofaba australis IT-1]